MTSYEQLLINLKAAPNRWLVTGCAGFIGSNLVEALLKQDQEVVGIDNFVTGYRHNIEEVESVVSTDQWKRFRLIEGNLEDMDVCRAGFAGINYVLHHGALGSVPRSISDPISSNGANVTGFLNMLVASRDANVDRFVYASSSSVYGDNEALPIREENIGNLLSPYAVTKRINELYAEQFAHHYGLCSRGLRYFNVFGPRQDPHGAYAAVIPKWIDAMIKGEVVEIFGDGETSRDFCYITNVIQANILAATRSNEKGSVHEAYNIGVGRRTTLNELYAYLLEELRKLRADVLLSKPEHLEFRPGDVRHSLACIDSASRSLGYRPTHMVREGIVEAMQWYVEN